MEGESKPGHSLPDSLENWIPPKPKPSDIITEDTFREVFEHSPIGIYRTTPDGRIILANPALVKMLKYISLEDLLQRDLNNNAYSPGYSRQAFKDKIERDGRVVGLESVWLRKDGKSICVRENARVVRDNSGQILYYEGTIEDISESKRLATRLAESERQLRHLVESSRDVIALFSVDGKYLYFHGPSDIGLSSRDLYGKTPAYLYGEESGREIIEHIGEVAATGETKRVELHLHPDGRESWTSNEFYPIRGNDGEIIAVGKISHNITDRRRAEIRLAESENRFKEMFMNAPLGYQSLDENGDFLYVNNKWVELTGYTREEIIGKNFSELVPPENVEKFDKYFMHFKHRGEIREVEFELIRKDGVVISTLFDGTIQYDGEGRFLRTHCIMQDITARKKTEESLRTSEAKWRSLVQNAPNEIIIFDIDGKIRFTNRATTFGEKNGDSAGNLFEYLPPEAHERVWQKMETVLDGGISETFEIRVPRPQSADRWYVYNLGSIREEGVLLSFIMIGSDITKRKFAELSLIESEDRLKRVIESSGDVIYMQDLDGTILYYHGPERYKLTPNDYIGKKSVDIFPPDKAAMVDEQNRSVIESGKPLKVENSWVMGGETFWFEVEIFPIFGPDGSLVALGKIARNITERKLAQEQLAASEERFRTVFESAHDAIFIKNNQLKYTDINLSIQELLELDRDEIIGKTSRDILNEEVTNHLDNLEKEVLSGKIVEEEFTMEINGKSKTLHVVRVPLKNSKNEINGLCGIARDITDRHRERQKLRESEEKYRTLVDNLNFGVSLIDREMNLISYNRKLAEMYPIITQSNKSKCFEIYYDPPRDSLCTGCPTIKSFEDGEIHEYTGKSNVDGQSRNVRSVSTPVLDNDGNVIYVIEMVEDVTDQLRLHSELAKIEKLDSIGILAGGIAHDFNNIMTAVMGNISLALNDLDPGSPVHRLVSEAEQAADRAQGLTQQLLTFSKGGQPLRKPNHLGELLRESAGFALTGSSIKCEFSVPSDLYPVEIDKGQIGQVIHNLVINAVQAMPDGGRIEITARNLFLKPDNTMTLKPGQYVMFSVEDSGTGIDEKHLKKIFDPFYTTKQFGSGLGLATSYSIIHNHAGHIAVDTKIGRGTRFDIYLPADSDLKPQAVKAEEIVVPFAGGKSRILVVDDEAGVRKVARVTLERLGYEVTEAADGGVAEQTYRQAFEDKRAFDAVILDLTIPGGAGGKKTFENLRKIDPDVRAIVSSGYSNDPIMADYRDYGFLGRVAKPYRASELGRVVAEIVRDNGDAETPADNQSR